MYPDHTVEWSGAATYYKTQGGKPKVRGVAERQQTMAPTTRKKLQTMQDASTCEDQHMSRPARVCMQDAST